MNAYKNAHVVKDIVLQAHFSKLHWASSITEWWEPARKKSGVLMKMQMFYPKTNKPAYFISQFMYVYLYEESTSQINFFTSRNDREKVRKGRRVSR